MASKPKAPPPRNYQNEMEVALRAQAAIQPELLALESKYAPQWQKIQQLGLSNQMDWLNSQFQQRIPQFGQNALAYTNALAPAVGRAGEIGREGVLSGMGQGSRNILSQMETQAMQGLQAGGALTDRDRQLAEDAARRAATARGLGGNQALVMEMLTSSQLSNQREDRARAYANQVLGINQGIAGTGGQLYGGSFNQGWASMGPQQMLGYSQGLEQNLGPQIMQPESQMSAQINQANYEMKWAQAQAAANAKNAMTGAVIGGLATLGGAYLGGPAMAAGGGGKKGFSFTW